MRSVISILVATALALPFAAESAGAGWKEKGEARRMKLMEKAESRALCYLLKPWPWSCACAIDSDGDGVMDDKDMCPGTPAGAIVDRRGCPLDGDKDGVPDGIDRCPDTPAGAKVDENGCPAEVKKLIDTGFITTTKILFDTGKSTLKPASNKELDAIGNILEQVPDLRIEIGGHTDSQGSDESNMKLSDERAKAVRDYLLENFADLKTGNLSSKGYGEAKPVTTNETAEGRAKNRRVEFRIVK